MAWVPRAVPKQAPRRLFHTVVPLEERKQIFLPEFTITLIRTPFLPPRYASFYVPLNLNKLDLKDYLKRLYGVKVLNVRSYVEQQKPTRERSMGKTGYGKWRRPMSKKRMTVEMEEPFVWPEEPTDLSPWDRDSFHDAKKMQEEFNESQRPESATKEPKLRREKLEKQSEMLQEGTETWTPTWKALGLSFDRADIGKAKGKGKGKGKAGSEGK